MNVCVCVCWGRGVFIYECYLYVKMLWVGVCVCAYDLWSYRSFAPAGAVVVLLLALLDLSSVLAPTRIAPILFLCLSVCQLLGDIVQQPGGIAIAIAIAIRQQNAIGLVRTSVGCHRRRFRRRIWRRVAIGQRLIAVLQPVRMTVGMAIGLGSGRFCCSLWNRLRHEQIVVGIDALAIAVRFGISVGQQRVLLLQ